MKAAAVALACVLRLAVQAQADEIARPLQQAAAQQPLAKPPASPAEPPAELRPWVDPSSAHQVGVAQSPPAPPTPKEQVAAPPGRDEPRRHQCLNPVETRQTVVAHRLTEPIRALRAGGAQGEALRAKLCKWKQDQFIYEVFVLRRDGRIVRLYMNAQNGQSVGSLDDDRH